MGIELLTDILIIFSLSVVVLYICHRLGISTIVGFLIIAAGVIVNALALDIVEQNFAAVLIFVGLLVTMIGLYSISRRKTPS